jgi:hypothetical protein
VSTAIERIVVQTTPQQKQSISAKAARLGLPVSELMRRGAEAYSPDDGELDTLAAEALASSERSIQAIDHALAFVDASNKRITQMEAEAERRHAEGAMENGG